jgi:crossover junction endodeoxyribonuclease RuvC
MKIIGIDPGLSSTGIGIVSGAGIDINGCSYGSIETSQKTSLPGRLHEIYRRLFGLLEVEKPDLMVIEDVFSLKQYPRSGIILGHVSGVILLAGRQIGMMTLEVPVREAKQVLTGNGNATKMQLEKSVRNLLKLSSPIRPLHASDALGLALIGLYRCGRRHCLK